MSEYILYGMALVSFSVGIWMIIWSVLSGQALVTVCGTVVTAFFVPAFRWVSQIRRENQNIRLLEIALGSARTADQAATALVKIYSNLASPPTAKSKGMRK